MRDLAEIRAQFPMLASMVRGKSLAYLDNAATTLKPRTVAEAVNLYLLHETSNVHRGVHHFSEKATEKFETIRTKIVKLLNAKSEKEIIFTSGATAAINLVARSYAGSKLNPNDSIAITAMEHHSNLVPWHMIAAEKKLQILAVSVTDDGSLDMHSLDQVLAQKPKILAVVHTSNALGTINPISEIVQRAHKHGTLVLVDASQAVMHAPVDVAELGCDFLVFSGHKTLGPTGVGVLWARQELLDAMPPFLGGGDMIRTVGLTRSTYAELPAKFEAGTPPIAEVIGLGAAIDFVSMVGFPQIHKLETELLRHATTELQKIPGLRVIGTSPHKASIVSFELEGVHPHDIGTLVDEEGVAIRTGHHCCQPLMERFNVPATARASMAFYNTHEEIDQLVRALHKVRELFG